MEHEDDNVDSFSTLPTEILQIIFAYLRPKFLFENVLPVCSRFFLVINNERWWNVRIQKLQLQRQFCDAERFGTSRVRSLDAVWRDEDAWANWDQQKRHVTATDKGAIDAVKLFSKITNRFCVSASSSYLRSRCTDTTFKVWSLDNRSENDGILYETAIGHSNTVCGIEMHGTDQFISGSFDRHVKLWNIGNSSVNEIAMQRTEAMVRDIAYENGVLACSTGIRTITLHDVRNGLQKIDRTSFLFHDYTWPLSIVFKGTFLHLAFTDRLVTVDIRKLTVPVQQHMFDRSFAPNYTVAIYMHWSDGLLQCANHKGDAQEFDASTLELRHSFSVCKAEECVCIRPVELFRNRGSFVAITGTVVKGFSLRPPHENLGTFSEFPDKQYPTAMDVSERDIVVGCNSGSLITWTKD